MTEKFNGQPLNQMSPAPGMTAERLKRAMEIIEARELQAQQAAQQAALQAQRDVEVLEQLLGVAQTPAAAFENTAPAMPTYNPVRSTERFTPSVEQPPVSQSETTSVVHPEMIVDDKYYHFDASVDNATREQIIAEKISQKKDVKYMHTTPDLNHTTFSVENQEELKRVLESEQPDAVATPNKPKRSSGPVPFFQPDSPENRYLISKDKEQKVVDKSTKEKVPFWTRRKKTLGAGVLALGVLSGGSVLAVQNLTGGSHDAAIIDENNAPTPVNPDLIPALTYTPLVEAFGGCIDENGGGPALGSVTTKSETRTSWKTGMIGANGGELTLETKDPATRIESTSKVQLESTADYTACVVAANVANVISVDVPNSEAPIAKVNLSNIDPQIRSKVTNIIDRGWSSGEFETPLIPAEEVIASGVEAKKIPADIATSFMAAYTDVPNAAVEAQAALNATTDTLATDGSVYSEQIKVVIKQKIESTIKEKVKRLAQDNLTKAKSISIEWIGELKDILAKKQPVPVANKVIIEPKSLIKDFVANPTPASNQAK